MVIAHLVLIGCKPPSTITYSNPGSRLERLLPELSKISSLSMRPTKDMKDIVLTLRLHDAPVDQTLAKIANAARGRWSIIEGSYTLYPDSDAVTRTRSDALAKHRALIELMLAQFHKSIEPRPPGITAETDTVMRRPEYVAFAKLIPYLDVGAIAELGFWQRIVYSSQPRALQRVLPTEADAVIAQLIQDVNGLPESEGGDPVHPIVAAPSKTDIVITRSTEWGGEILSAEINVYDSAGSCILTKNLSAAAPGPGWAGRDRTIPRAGKQLAIPEGALEMFRYWREGGPSTPAVEEALAHPEERDPIESVGAELVAYADLEGVQLAASITDYILLSWPTFRESLTDAWVRRTLEKNHAETTPGWVVLRRPIRTVLDVDDSEATMDRHALRLFTEAVPGLRPLNLQTAIKAIRLGWPEAKSLPQGELLPQMNWLDDDRLLATLAQLSDDQVDDLARGKQIKLTSTSESFRRYFAELAQTAAGQAFSLEQLASNGAQILVACRTDFRGEFTEIADSPIPSAGFIRLVKTDSEALEISTKDRRIPPHLSLGELAESIAINQAPGKFRRCTLHAYQLRFYITPEVYFTEEGTIYDPPTDNRMITAKELPPKMAAELQRLIAEAKARSGGDGSAGVTPP